MASAKRLQYERASILNDGLRDALLNKKYFGALLHRARRRSFWMEWLIAGTASGSGIAGWALWQTGYGAVLWSVLAGAAAVMGVTKPLLQLDQQIEAFSKLYGSYAKMVFDLEALMMQVRLQDAIEAPVMQQYTEIIKISGELVALEPPIADRRLVRRCREDVNREMPMEQFWWP